MTFPPFTNQRTSGNRFITNQSTSRESPVETPPNSETVPEQGSPLEPAVKSASSLGVINDQRLVPNQVTVWRVHCVASLIAQTDKTVSELGKHTAGPHLPAIRPESS